MELYAKGKRSLVYRHRGVVAKLARPESKAVGRIENEAFWLQVVNRYGIGPQFLEYHQGVVFMRFVEGEFLLPYLSHCTEREKEEVLLSLLDQCRVLDRIGVTKYEMHRPLKHVLVCDGVPVLLDFERCGRRERPKNVTQLCQFYHRFFGMEGILEQAKNYKRTYSEPAYRILRAWIRKRINSK